MTVNKIEKLSDYKREMKSFVRGVIKSKVFNGEDGKLNFIVTKDDENVVAMTVTNKFNTAEFVAEVSTRVYNKISNDLYTKTIEQFNKLKNFAGMSVIVEN